MSRFAAAAAKASASTPKASAPKAAAPIVKGKSTPKAAAPVLTTLEDKKKYVRSQDLKIEDVTESIKNEPNKAAKKELETKLKKMREDETYMKAKSDIKEAEAQAVRDAERAAASEKASSTVAGKVDTKASAKASAKALVDAVHIKADAATFTQISQALAASGKDAVTAKSTAVAQLESVAFATPFALPMLDKMVELFADSKLGAPAVKAACAIVMKMKPQGHGIASTVMPALLKGMEDKKWKTKAGCIEVLLPCLEQMQEETPAQLASSLPLIVPKLAEAALEVRAEIRNATSAVLRKIGSLVASPEIQKLSQDLVTALAEPTNQKHTQSVLAKMGNQTFLSLIDPASLSLLMPVVVRGLKERDSMSKKWSAQIFGSASMLAQDVDNMGPYLKSTIPLLKAALSDPVPEVQREAAKAFGILEQVLPELSFQQTQPWLFERLRNGDVGEQMGCALALAEVFLKMDTSKAGELVPEIEAGAMEENIKIRRGFMELLEAAPHAMKMLFVPYIARLFPAMMLGITGDSEKDEDVGLKAANSLVQRFGNLCPELLLPGIEVVYIANLHSDSNEARARQQVLREKVAGLLGKIADKILEHKKFGQDMLSTDDCSTKETREYLLCLVVLMRSDFDAGVKRQANATWKACGGAPKLQKLLLPKLKEMLLIMRRGDKGCGAQALALDMLAQFVKDKEMDAVDGEQPEKAAPFVFKVAADRISGSAAGDIVAGRVPEAVGEVTSRFERFVSDFGDSVVDFVDMADAFKPLNDAVRSHICCVSSSVIVEGRKWKRSGATIAASIAEALKGIALVALDGEAERFCVEAPVLAEGIARAALGQKFDVAADDDANCAETLLRVENLLLMYGAGHLLLKDTLLVMKKNHRYGVVGQNGAGKTTLMKEIAGHRIVGMPQDLKCVHVDDSKLGEMSKSCLTSLEYVRKMAKDIGVDSAGRETLIGVGFAEKMLDEPVADLSTGWRMRLTLAVSMLKHADLVLLDEPTNHLDEESVQWLADYIVSITSSSVMVISHEPKFLNRICTDVVAYVDKKLEYTEGNFDTFAAKKGLSKEQIDAMLSGNLSFDEKKDDDDGDEGGEKPKPVSSAPVAGPPKLSFPIPGTMEGVKSGSKTVLETKALNFRFSKEKDYLISDCSVKLSLNSRVAICGRNGCGKSVLMTLLCSEMSPSEGKSGELGEVWRHCNLRLAYMKQDHLKALGPFFDTSPFVYISSRFKDGYDGDLQKRLMEPEDDDEADRRKALAKEYGKYGNEVEELVSRTKVGSQLAYEVRWKGLDDPKQNTIVPISTLKAMGLEKVVIACDERIAAKAAGLDQRPLTRREITRHVEAFGIDEEMCCNRQIRGFSAGQKVRLSLAAMFWTKPHLIALDEPTNYLDVETVEALAKALNTFRGGILMIEPKTDFVERICNEKWHLEGGTVTVEKLKNNVKRQA
jgi:ATPase subunit of ABC transporter with duplicated ATPase domains